MSKLSLDIIILLLASSILLLFSLLAFIPFIDLSFIIPIVSVTVLVVAFISSVYDVVSSMTLKTSWESLVILFTFSFKISILSKHSLAEPSINLLSSITLLTKFLTEFLIFSISLEIKPISSSWFIIDSSTLTLKSPLDIANKVFTTLFIGSLMYLFKNIKIKNAVSIENIRIIPSIINNVFLISLYEFSAEISQDTIPKTSPDLSFIGTLHDISIPHSSSLYGFVNVSIPLLRDSSASSVS